jgi:hypothetical protein
MDGLTFSCPVCGADVPRKAKSCPECGACEKSGWSEDQYLDGIDLPDPDYDRPAPQAGMSRFWWFVAVVILVAFALLTLRGMW